MLPSKQSPWVVLRWRRLGNRLVLSYQDSAGNRVQAPRGIPRAGDWRETWLTIPWPGLAERVLLHTRLGAHLAARLAELPLLQPPPYSTGPVPLAVFVQSPPGEDSAAGESLASQVLAAEMDPDRAQIVRLPRRGWKQRTPFRLPFRILPADAAGQAVADVLLRHNWLVHEEVRRYGMQITPPPGEPLSRALRRTPYDIVIGSGTPDAPLLSLLTGGMPRGEHRPRLIILLDGATPPPAPLPTGISLLNVPAGAAADWTAEFVLGLVHDQPVHEAVRSANRTYGGQLPAAPVLVSDPASNQALRMADARYALRGEVSRLRVQAPGLEWLRLSGGGSADLARMTLPGDSLSRAQNLSLDAAFERESSGLEPLAQAEKELDSAAAAMREMRAKASPPAGVDGPGKPKQAEPANERRVDLAMEQAVTRRNVDGREELLPGVFREIDRADPLTPGAMYRVRVHIGLPLPESLVVNEVPPIDLLLPAPDNDLGHQLEVVIYPKRFRLLSRAVKPLRLPPSGSSNPVYFRLRAPDEEGDAELRVALYHRDHMVQSFLVTALVSSRHTDGGSHVQARLDFTATEAFEAGEILRLAQRAVSFAVNQDGGGSHTFMVKRGGTAEAFSLTEQVVREQVEAFRKLLEDATFVPPIVRGSEQPRFNSYPDPGAEAEPAFHDCVRRLAGFGRELHHLLLARVSDPVAAQLRALIPESDRVIQVVRHDANLTFPWGIVYDYPLGPDVAGAAPRPVCVGKPLGLGTAPPSRRPRGCPHNPGHDVYCIDGFWGVRHRLEQRIGTQRTAETVVLRPAGRPGVMLATGIGDPNATELAGKLSAKLGAELAILRKEDDLLALLWDPARRPAVLVVLGHLETQETTGEPRGPRIVLLPRETWPPPAAVPDEHWLMSPAVSDMVHSFGRWSDGPRTLVLLMACSSAATEVGTVNDLVTTLTPVGVSAVVGTETPVFTRLAARFAAEVTLALWDDPALTLGEAVQSFNRSLIRSGNPLAFAFTCVGNADLTIST